MNGEERVPVSIGMKLVSLLLMVGGVLGIGLTAWLDSNLVSSGQVALFSPSVAITGYFIVVFGWAAWTGRNLSIGYRRAVRQAQILFALQIPLFRIPGFVYEFHTGFTASIGIANGAAFNFSFHLGSSANFYFSPPIHGFYFAVNFVALAVLIYLQRKSREVPATAVPPPTIPLTPPPPPMQLE